MADVVVAGGGVIGMLCALELTRRGAQVTLLDNGDYFPPASSAAGGILSPLFPWRYPRAVNHLCRDALSAYLQLAEQARVAGSDDIDIMTTGLRAWCSDAPERVADWARSVQVAVEHIGTAQDAAQDGAHEYWLEGVGSVRCSRLLKGLSALLVASGVTLRSTALTGFAVSERGVDCQTTSGVLVASQLVLATGWQLHKWLPSHYAASLFPAKGEMLAYQLAPGALAEIRLSERGYVIPRRDGLVVVGSTLEPGVSDTTQTAVACQRLEQTAHALLPALRGAAPAFQWAGVRPGTERPAPLMDQLPDTDGKVWVCGGHYRNGIVMAPASARLLVQVMTGELERSAMADYSFSSPGSSDNF